MVKRRKTLRSDCRFVSIRHDILEKFTERSDETSSLTKVALTAGWLRPSRQDQTHICTRVCACAAATSWFDSEALFENGLVNLTVCLAFLGWASSTRTPLRRAKLGSFQSKGKSRVEHHQTDFSFRFQLFLEWTMTGVWWFFFAQTKAVSSVDAKCFGLENIHRLPKYAFT